MSILLVDDDPDFLESMVWLLTANGYEVFEAKSGREALRILEMRPEINLIISDFYMADGNGMFLLSQVRSKDPLSPAFFVMTGQSDMETDDIKNRGAQEVIFKPFPIQQFLQMVKKIC